MNKKVILVLAVAFLIILGSVIFFRNRSSMVESIQSPSPMTTQQTIIDEVENEGTDSSDTSTVKEITVTGSNFKFEPQIIRVKKGEKVRIIFKNSGGTHDFVIDNLELSTKQIQTGQQEVLEFSPLTLGSFEYYCSVGNHRDQGMKGTLIVE